MYPLNKKNNAVEKVNTAFHQALEKESVIGINKLYNDCECAKTNWFTPKISKTIINHVHSVQQWGSLLDHLANLIEKLSNSPSPDSEILEFLDSNTNKSSSISLMESYTGALQSLINWKADPLIKGGELSFFDRLKKIDQKYKFPITIFSISLLFKNCETGLIENYYSHEFDEVNSQLIELNKWLQFITNKIDKKEPYDNRPPREMQKSLEDIKQKYSCQSLEEAVDISATSDIASVLFKLYGAMRLMNTAMEWGLVSKETKASQAFSNGMELGATFIKFLSALNKKYHNHFFEAWLVTAHAQIAFCGLLVCERNPSLIKKLIKRIEASMVEAFIATKDAFLKTKYYAQFLFLFMLRIKNKPLNKQKKRDFLFYLKLTLAAEEDGYLNLAFLLNGNLYKHFPKALRDKSSEVAEIIKILLTLLQKIWNKLKPVSTSERNQYWINYYKENNMLKMAKQVKDESPNETKEKLAIVEEKYKSIKTILKKLVPTKKKTVVEQEIISEIPKPENFPQKSVNISSSDIDFPEKPFVTSYPKEDEVTKYYKPIIKKAEPVLQKQETKLEALKERSSNKQPSKLPESLYSIPVEWMASKPYVFFAPYQDLKGKKITEEQYQRHQNIAKDGCGFIPHASKTKSKARGYRFLGGDIWAKTYICGEDSRGLIRPVTQKDIDKYEELKDFLSEENDTDTSKDLYILDSFKIHRDRK